MLYDKVQVVIEFKVGEESFYFHPATPLCLFSLRSQGRSFMILPPAVNPIRSITVWEDGVPEDQYNGRRAVAQSSISAMYLSSIRPARADRRLAIAFYGSWGNFDTRKPPIAVVRAHKSQYRICCVVTLQYWGSLVGYDVRSQLQQGDDHGRVLCTRR
jgi:hypothetical protein